MILTRATRPRLFPTQYGHAALSRAIEVTCAYQSDSSSKRPVASAVLDSLCHLHPGAPRPQLPRHSLGPSPDRTGLRPHSHNDPEDFP